MLTGLTAFGERLYRIRKNRYYQAFIRINLILQLLLVLIEPRTSIAMASPLLSRHTSRGRLAGGF